MTPPKCEAQLRTISEPMATSAITGVIFLPAETKSPRSLATKAVGGFCLFRMSLFICAAIFLEESSHKGGPLV